MEGNNESILAAKSSEVKFEVQRLTSLINLCESNGINPGVTLADLDALVGPFLSDPTDLGYLAVTSRLAKVHKHLHELLYAPPPRG